MTGIIDYEAGNLASVQNALKRLNAEFFISNNPDELSRAERIIFPGVGEASSAMTRLRKNKLDLLIQDFPRPLLGICLGMQLLCKSSEEGKGSECEGLGIFSEKVLRFQVNDALTEKVPHMGWNSISVSADRSDSLLKGIKSGKDFYFVHSYYVTRGENTTATCSYILDFAAVMQKDNFYATQFHPEKSGMDGSVILENFLSL
jgi:glutamine amidotransferase